MAQTNRLRDLDARLIDHYIDIDSARYPGGRADARLRQSAVSVWVIIAYLPIYNNDLDKVADHFVISREEVEAAIAYYHCNKEFVDARIELNRA